MTSPVKIPQKRKSTRRLFISNGLRLVTGCLILASGRVLVGCAESADSRAPTHLEIPLADLPVGQRVRHDLGRTPVEVIRTEEGVVARSLLCTHRGCIVKWDVERGHYQCPCHDGRFDAQGQVIFGPPTEPLAQLPVTITETSVIVGG